MDMENDMPSSLEYLTSRGKGKREALLLAGLLLIGSLLSTTPCEHWKGEAPYLTMSKCWGILLRLRSLKLELGGLVIKRLT